MHNDKPASWNGIGRRDIACKTDWGHARLEGLLREVDVLDGEQAGAEGRHCAVTHDGGARGRQDVCQECYGAGCQKHDIGVVLGIQQVYLQAAIP